MRQRRWPQACPVTLLGRTRPLGRLLLLALVVVLLGGVIFLVTWEIPAPTAQVETVIPDERLPR
jgi:hypothetical protein